MNTQFKKGVLDLLILHAINIKDRYGYEIVQQISEAVAITEGTVYPLLKRLKNDNYVETYLKESTEGPTRKYYKITMDGKKQLQNLTQEWKGFAKTVHNFLKISK